jgi:hypothetical protein
VLLFAPLDASLLPKPPKRLLAGCAGVELGAALPNMFGVEDEDMGAGLAAPPPKRDEALLPPEPAWPNMLVPGGGPAGVVEGREKVLLGAGVAAGVDEPAALLAFAYY